MMHAGLGAIFLLAMVAASCNGFQFYQTLMPNGDKVRHPCLANKLWKGVGHFNEQGGGARNPFGVDFKNAGAQWTRALCMKDSDGDGLSNGQELGDPNCIWTTGETPTRVTNITHPGVCEPINSPTCKGRNKADWNLCQSEQFVCNDTKGPNVTTLDLRMKYTTVPKKITNYYCQAFTLPNETDYHLIAVEPLINNTNVMHHILLFGCNSKPADQHYSDPYECGMGGTNCGTILAGWTLGSNGECFRNHSGVRVGLKGYKYLVMQVHWNNPEMRSDYKDSSGMRLYLTTKLRGNDSAIFTLGQRYLEIPSGQNSYLQEAECSANCTSRHLPHPIYLLNVIPHMHYAGRYSEISLYRGRQKIRDLVPYSQVSYDQPKLYEFDPPIELKPGDRMHMKCVYKTTNENNTIYYGDATADEMCFGFFRYFPAQTKLDSCIKYGEVDFCTVNDVQNGGDGTNPGRIGNCSNISIFIGYTLPTQWAPLIQEHCDYSIQVCRPACKAVVKQMNQDPCWQGWAKKYIEFISIYTNVNSLRELRLATTPCAMEIIHENLQTVARKPDILATRAPQTQTDESLSEAQKTILIAVGSVVVAIVLLSVAAFGMYRAFIYRPKANMNRASAYMQPGVTSGVNKGYDNMAYPTMKSAEYSGNL